MNFPPAPANPEPLAPDLAPNIAETLAPILTHILLVATRLLQTLANRTRTAQALRPIFATTLASARIARAIRLATLLLARLHQQPTPAPRPALRLAPRPAPHPAPAAPGPQTPNPPRTRASFADPERAFARRPIPDILAAITRELTLAARALGLPMPEPLQALCLRATLAAAGLEPPITPTPTPTIPNPGLPVLQDPSPQPPTPRKPLPAALRTFPHRHTPEPAETLEL